MRVRGWVLSLVLLAGASWAEEPTSRSLARLPAAEARLLASRVTQAALFKNGLALVTREVAVPGPGDYLLGSLPVPVHGSFWLLPPDGVTIVSASAVSAPRRTAAEAVSMVDLLRANEGRQVEVQTADGWVEATIAKVPEQVPDLPVTLRSGDDGSWYWAPRRAYHLPELDPARSAAPPGFVLFNAEGGQWAVAPDRILGLRGSELTTRFTRAAPGAALRLQLEGGGGVLTLHYLAWGLTWAPSYRVDVVDEANAQVAMKAVVLNDIEELGDVELSFISGYPNLQYAATVDPLALYGDVADFLASLANRDRYREAPAMAQQVVLSNAYAPSSPPAIGAPPEGADLGGVAEDLFYYPRPHVSLGRGERGYYPLFALTVPCRSVHVWNLDDQTGSRDPWDRGRREDESIALPPVWHVLRLTNAGTVPWTTGPAMIQREGRLLGQDTLFYTGPGRETDLQVTRAAGVRAEHRELETDRQRGARQFYGTNFDRLTIKGEVRVWNDKPKDLVLEVRRTVDGEVGSSSPEAEVVALADNPRAVNPRQQLHWEVAVKAGDKAYLTYLYSAYVRP